MTRKFIRDCLVKGFAIFFYPVWTISLGVFFWEAFRHLYAPFFERVLLATTLLFMPLFLFAVQLRIEELLKLSQQDNDSGSAK